MEPSPDSNATSDEQALRHVLEVTRQLAAPLELTAMLSKVTEAAKAVLAADRSSLFLYDPKTNELYTTIADGTKQIRLAMNKGIAGQCGSTRQIINVPDCYNDPRFNSDVDRKTGYHTSCLITVPLLGLDDQLVGVMQLLNAARGFFDARDERIAQALASQAAVAIHRSILLEERLIKLKLERDLDLARQIQQDVLPSTLPCIPGYQMGAYCLPTDATGGDIYDLIALPMAEETDEMDTTNADAVPESLVILLADATGHGIGPAMSVTQARSMLRLGLRVGAPLGELVRHINAQVHQDLPDRRFITAFMGRLDLATHDVDYLSAGQGPIIHVNGATGQCDLRNASTIPLGIMAELPLEQESEHMPLAPGDMLVLLTDGFFEAQNPQGEQLGNDRVIDHLIANRTEPVEQIVEGLVAMLHKFTHNAPSQDDLTAVIIRRDSAN